MSDTARHDIRDRDDILRLMQTFYDRLLADPLLRPVFVEAARINLAHHLPVLVDFWEHILFGEGNYRGNPMQVHLALHEKTPLTKAHFDTWMQYFRRTVEEMFEGPVALQAVTRAASIAIVMQQKIYLQDIGKTDSN